MDGAALLSDLRARTGLSVRSLARIAGVSPASIDRIEHRRVSPTATLERVLESLGYRLELAAVTADPGPMTREDRRSLAYHRLVAAKLLTDPAGVRATGRRNLATMRRADPSGRSARDHDTWSDLLDRDDHDLVGALLDPSPRGRELRPTSPFAGVLTAEERATVYPRAGAQRAS